MYISISGDVPRFYILRRHFGMLHFLSVFTSFLFRLILNTTEMILILLHNEIWTGTYLWNTDDVAFLTSAGRRTDAAGEMRWDAAIPALALLHRPLGRRPGVRGGTRKGWSGWRCKVPPLKQSKKLISFTASQRMSYSYVHKLVVSLM